MNARALAVKTGAVLGDLLVKRAFGNRPVTLVGYSLGSLVIFEALRYLAGLPVSESFGLVEDAFMFGTPVAADPKIWARIRRVTAGRVVNGYASDDYVLAVLSRASDASWRVAGLGAVDVQGVENVHCEEVTGHTMWRGMVGKYLETCHARGIVQSEVEAQVHVAEEQMPEPEIAPET
jgi:pimeloyl-ACP methyl ester carboxylesterase